MSNLKLNVLIIIFYYINFLNYYVDNYSPPNIILSEFHTMAVPIL